MCKNIFYISIIFFTVACRVPNYHFENSFQTTGLDFSRGKWLLNEVDCPSNVHKQITNLSYSDFHSFIENRLCLTNEVAGIILPQKIPFNPSKKTLNDIKLGANFDYFINIKAVSLKNELGIVDFTPHKLYSDRTSSVEVAIEIYDLNLKEIIYSQKVIGSINSSKDNNDVHFSHANRNLIISAYKKLMRDINKKSIKNKL